MATISCAAWTVFFSPVRNAIKNCQFTVHSASELWTSHGEAKSLAVLIAANRWNQKWTWTRYPPRLYLITSKCMNAVSTVHYLNLAFKYSETKKQFRSVNLS